MDKLDFTQEIYEQSSNLSQKSEKHLPTVAAFDEELVNEYYA